MTHLHSYPSIYTVGHAAIQELFADPVVVQEKVDGSQFSFGVRETTTTGEPPVLVCRSKGANILPDAPEKMFTRAVETAKALQAAGLLRPSVIYRCEYLREPQHNTLKYDRVPNQHLILFDVENGLDLYCTPEQLAEEAGKLGLECVPTLHVGQVDSFDQLVSLVGVPSVLGGVKAEGVVIKNYHRFGVDKRPLFGKFVRPEFREENKAAWRAVNPTAGDIVNQCVKAYATEARWQKAVQHLRDAGQLEGSPRDIGKLIKEVPADVLKECEGDIRKALWSWAWPQINRGVNRGLAEWYKEQLAKSAFVGTSTQGEEGTK